MQPKKQINIFLKKWVNRHRMWFWRPKYEQNTWTFHCQHCNIYSVGQDAFSHFLLLTYLPTGTHVTHTAQWVLASNLLLFSQPPGCVWLCDLMNGSKPGLSVPHRLLDFAQVHVHCISDAVQPSHPLTPSSPSALNLSLHPGLSQWVVSLHQMTKI